MSRVFSDDDVVDDDDDDDDDDDADVENYGDDMDSQMSINHFIIDIHNWTMDIHIWMGVHISIYVFIIIL